MFSKSKLAFNIKQEEKILNEPAAIYWFNEILFVILSSLKNGLHLASSVLQGQLIIRVASAASKWFQWPLNGLSGLYMASNDLGGQLVVKMASMSPF